LAVALSLAGGKVGLLDVDIHGPSIPKMLHLDKARIRTENETMLPVEVGALKVMSIGFLLSKADQAVIWRGPMKMGAIRQFLADVRWGDLDYLIIDLPPGTGDEPLTIGQLIPDADGAVVVTTPQDVALLNSRKSVGFSRQLKIPVLGIVENMSGLICPHCGKEIDLFKVGGGEKAAKELKVPFLGRIPLDPKVVESGDDGMPIVLADSESPAAVAFGTLVDNILKQTERKGRK
ncbi:MAG: Mrp/NBP35 family ATP-binding protein, partial [Methanomassiliicoccales archaeon]|nr:Mrp/NBP35 family ATP-binding protein [Methanomassiliicoccales archaeon]